MKSLNDYAIPIFKGFHQEDLLLGVQKPIFIGILLLLVLSWYLFGTIPAVVITAVIYIPCYFITKHDVNMLSIALSTLFTEPDELEG